MDSKYLLAWIQENQIIERLFQSKLSDMHPELIKRSKNLLKFMASEKFLNQVWIRSAAFARAANRGPHNRPFLNHRGTWT